MNPILSYPKNSTNANSLRKTANRSSTAVADVSSSDKWNPNVPFHCTQEEFLEHIHSIEQGEFISLEEHQRRLDTWWKNRLK